MIKFILFFVVLIGTINMVNADYPVKFTGASNRDILNDELKENFEGFKVYLQNSSYYQKSINTRLGMDFVMLLVNKSHDSNVRMALDYLLKTGGPFTTYYKASPQEEVLLIAAAQIVAEQEPELEKVTYHITESPLLQRHSLCVLKIQEEVISGKATHFFRKNLVLPKVAEDIPNELKTQNMNIETGWGHFKKLLLSPVLFEEEMRTSNSKTSWLNDAELIGFQMGVMPNIRGDYIDDLWAKDNPWMESQHNYVQWWFPIETVGMGDGNKTPRFLKSTERILQEDVLARIYVQQMVRVSFARKSHFWGQRAVYKSDNSLILELVMETDESETWGNKWEKNWAVEKTHNHLRMTRFLKALKLLDYIKKEEHFSII